MNNKLRTALLGMPYLGPRLRQWLAAAEELERLKPGDFYSPIASDETIEAYARFDVCGTRVINLGETRLSAVEIDTNAQCELLQQFERDGLLATDWMKRYADNEFFHRMDAAILHAMISHHKPKRIIEIGSGFSTLAILDSLEANKLDNTELTLIEPFPERLLNNISSPDLRRFKLLQRPLEAADISDICQLQYDDLLLVDSSHVYKIGSDVQLLFESIYPALEQGVLLHIHDVFFPFDYPASWLRRGHHYNEAYVLRTFLQFNRSFEILLWNNLMRHLSGRPFPACLRPPENQIACSIWLRRC